MEPIIVTVQQGRESLLPMPETAYKFYERLICNVAITLAELPPHISHVGYRTKVNELIQSFLG